MHDILTYLRFQEPLKFIQVISAFSLLPPEKLGFDPTIEMLVSPNHAVPSYKPNEEFIKAYEAARHNRQWVIKMNDGSKYVTVETVSSVRAGFMRGRGGIVWVVVPFDRSNEESKVSRPFESMRSLLMEIYDSRFSFSSNRGGLVKSRVKATFMTSPNATLLARLNVVKRC